MIPSLRQTVLLPPVRDPNARDYIRRVEAADEQSLEPLVQRAIDAFVRGCKADGIWSAIKASCILAGARTLSGALVPLVGTAPTNFNFVDGDYNRKTGLVGNGSTKYLDSNRNNNADPQDNRHLSVFPTTVAATAGQFFGGASGATTNQRMEIAPQSTGHLFRCLNNTFPTFGNNATSAGALIGMSRAAAGSFTARCNSASNASATTSNEVGSNTFLLFATQATSNVPSGYGAHRLSFYSIGESLGLALLDARVTTLINAIGAALP